MKTIVLLFVSILLASCNEGLPKTEQVKEPYISIKKKRIRRLPI